MPKVSAKGLDVGEVFRDAGLDAAGLRDLGDVEPETRMAFLHPGFADPQRLRVLPGLQATWFRDDEFFGQEWAVSPSSNRMGVRLQGTPLTVPARELVSEPVAPGAVPVTRDGQCIVLGVDGQTIGGYPKIAHVIDADCDWLGQLRAGQRVRFVAVTAEEAAVVLREQRERLRRWIVRLRASFPLAG